MTSLIKDAAGIFLSTLENIAIDKSVKDRLDLDGDVLVLDRKPVADAADVTLIAIGKASLSLARAFEGLLGPRVGQGLVVTDRRHRITVKSRVIVAGHPVPDANSVVAGHAVLDLIESCPRESLLVFLISGGASALVDLPVSSEISLADLGELNRLLVSSGARIGEINVVRKHLSAIKGGRLGFAARNRRSVSFCVSDVNPGDVKSLASNPLLPDDASLGSFYDTLRNYELIAHLPESIRVMVRDGRVPTLPDADGEWGPACFAVLSDSRTAVNQAMIIAEERGFRAEICEDFDEGPLEEVADGLIERLAILRSREKGRPVCMLSGGEVSCKVPLESGGPGGLGGRNQHFVLYSAARLATIGIESPTAVLSCGTDGIDGNSIAAGAAADFRTVEDARSVGLDSTEYLRSFNSYSFFRKFGGAIVTGPTGNNVRDIKILLAGP
ncbi:MAG TPA: DUF4147 domain-containing protein [Blastocatellia bacterium]|nr:DUF4147 domain-containing protein [Blastocatellia bacterium]